MFTHVADRPRLPQRILRLWRRHEFGLTDSAGPYLEVSPNQSKRWFWKYYFDGKEMRLALGIYDEPGSTKVVFSLNAARDPRELLRTGVDPTQQRQLDKLTRQTRSGTTFEAVARELHAIELKAWSKQYGERWIERMEKDLFPWTAACRCPPSPPRCFFTLCVGRVFEVDAVLACGDLLLCRSGRCGTGNCCEAGGAKGH